MRHFLSKFKNRCLGKLPGILGIEDLDPVTIGILDEGDVLHLAVVGLLHKSHSQLLKALACRLNIHHCKADVTCKCTGSC